MKTIGFVDYFMSEWHANNYPAMIEKYCALGKEEREIIKNAYNRLGMSARAYHKILRVARTVADLDGAVNITVKHLAEAIGYRGLDRKYW